MKLLDKGFVYGEEIECFIFGSTHLLKIVANGYEEGEVLDENLIEEINWLISSNVLDDLIVQKKVLKKINYLYEECNQNHIECTNLSKEIKITSILLDINEKIIAFGGESDCDVEYGIAIVFKNRKFFNVTDYSSFNVRPMPYELEIFNDIEVEQRNIDQGLNTALSFFEKARKKYEE